VGSRQSLDPPQRDHLLTLKSSLPHLPGWVEEEEEEEEKEAKEEEKGKREMR
jgi:hypothetical protein